MELTPKIRLYVEAALQPGVSIALSPEQSHYLLNVMRCADGTPLALFNGKDGEWLARLMFVSKKKVDAQVVSQRKALMPVPDVWYLFAPIKNGRIDFIVQKATELGAAGILPVTTERTIVSRVNEERLQANAIEAAEQSERTDIPTVHSSQKLEKLLASWPKDRILLYGDETGRGRAPNDLFSSLPENGKWAVLIGPEGGFSPAELERMHKAEFAYGLSIGPRILRADTAGLAALTIVMAFRGDWRYQPGYKG